MKHSTVSSPDLRSAEARAQLARQRLRVATAEWALAGGLLGRRRPLTMVAAALAAGCLAGARPGVCAALLRVGARAALMRLR